MKLKSIANGVLQKFGLRLVRSSTFVPATPRPAVVRVIGDSDRPARRLVPAANLPPPRCNDLAPTQSRPGLQRELAAHVDNLRGNGITVFKTDQANAARWLAQAQFDRDMTNLHSSWDWCGNSILSNNHVIRTSLPSDGLRQELRDLFSQESFDTFFREVLGCPITVANCRVWRSLPHPGGGQGPQSWHGDGCPAGILRGVLYLTDVSEDSGPFQYKDDAGKIHTVLGRAGDLLIFDAVRLLHRAMPPK